MLIHVEISRRRELEIKAAVFREQFKHVIEKPDAGRNVIPPAPFNR
jgi:hypothetical protein